MSDEQFMQRALELADFAAKRQEVPVGAVLVHRNEIIAEGYNQPISASDPTAHAEIMALRAAGLVQKNYRLVDTTLYVTLEPCAMCVGAMVHARISHLVFAATDEKSGAVCGHFPLLNATCFNHQITWQKGLYRDIASAQLSDFFKHKRALAKEKRC